MYVQKAHGSVRLQVGLQHIPAKCEKKLSQMFITGEGTTSSRLIQTHIIELFFLILVLEITTEDTKRS